MKASSSTSPTRFSSEPGGPEDLVLRSLAPADLPQLLGLCAEHAAYEQAAFVDNGQAERWALHLFGPHPAAYGLVVARKTDLLGFATYRPEYSTWDAAHYLHLDCLYLRPEVRGRGVGRRVMAAVAHEAHRLGCERMQWQTPVFNAGAIRFYQQLGATEKPKVRFYLNPNLAAGSPG